MSQPPAFQPGRRRSRIRSTARRRGLRLTSTRTGFLDEALAEFRDRLGHGRGKEQASAIFGSIAGTRGQRLDEAEIHHLSASSSTKISTWRSRSRARWSIRSSRRPGVATAHRSPASARGPAFRRARRRKCTAPTGRDSGIAAHVLGDLRGELTRWARKHQHAAAGIDAAHGLCGEAVERRQRKGSGLSGAVCAMPNRSRPSSKAGIASRWIGVGSV